MQVNNSVSQSKPISK